MIGHLGSALGDRVYGCSLERAPFRVQSRSFFVIDFRSHILLSYPLKLEHVSRSFAWIHRNVKICTVL